MKVLIADPVAREGIEILRHEFDVDVKTGLKPEELKAIIGDYDALVVRSETQVTPDVIEAGKKLQVVARAGVGLDNINIDAATKKGIIVVNAPTGNTIAATEHTMAMMLALARLPPTTSSSAAPGSAAPSWASNLKARPLASSDWVMSVRKSPGVPALSR